MVSDRVIVGSFPESFSRAMEIQLYGLVVCLSVCLSLTLSPSLSLSLSHSLSISVSLSLTLSISLHLCLSLSRSVCISHCLPSYLSKMSIFKDYNERYPSTYYNYVSVPCLLITDFTPTRREAFIQSLCKVKNFVIIFINTIILWYVDTPCNTGLPE